MKRLVALFLTMTCVGAAATKPLGRYERWRVRRALLTLWPEATFGQTRALLDRLPEYAREAGDQPGHAAARLGARVAELVRAEIRARDEGLEPNTARLAEVVILILNAYRETGRGALYKELERVEAKLMVLYGIMTSAGVLSAGALGVRFHAPPIGLYDGMMWVGLTGMGVSTTYWTAVHSRHVPTWPGTMYGRMRRADKTTRAFAHAVDTGLDGEPRWRRDHDPNEPNYVIRDLDALVRALWSSDGVSASCQGLLTEDLERTEAS